jgi:hypothetical protein
VRDSGFVRGSAVDGNIRPHSIIARHRDTGRPRLARRAAYGSGGIVRRRELAALVVVRVELRKPSPRPFDGFARLSRPPARRREPQIRPLHEGRGGNRESVADGARQPLVITVVERGLARLDQLEVGGHELGLSPPRQIAAHPRVEIVLERADLVGRPFPGQGGEGVGRRARLVIVERGGVASERDIDGEGDLLECRLWLA